MHRRSGCSGNATLVVNVPAGNFLYYVDKPKLVFCSQRLHYNE